MVLGMSNAYLTSSGGGSGAGEPSVTASAIVAHAIGSHILRVDGYSHTLALGNGKCFKSQTFVVGGHRWQLEYYPDGDKSSYSGWISVFLRLDNPNYVDEVKAKFEISLLDQDGNPVPSYIRTSTMCSFSGARVALGFHDLIRRSDLEESVYLKDDVFSVRCDVTVAAKEIITRAIPVPAAGETMV